jgi:hypothetical protein
VVEPLAGHATKTINANGIKVQVTRSFPLEIMRMTQVQK